MAKASEHYNERRRILGEELKGNKRQIDALTVIRVLTFLAFGVCFALFLSLEVNLFALASLLSLVVFGVAVKRSIRLSGHRALLRSQIFVIESELKTLNLDTTSWQNGREFRNPSHAFSHDLDLFGDRSLFQLINRCGLADGRHSLACEMQSPCVKPDQIGKRQEAIEELVRKPIWRERLLAKTLMIKEDSLDTNSLIAWAEKEIDRPIPSWVKILYVIVPLIQGTNVYLYTEGLISGGLMTFILLLPVMVAVARVKRSNASFGELDQSHKQLEALSAVLFEIEQEEFGKEQLSVLANQTRQGALAFRRLESIMSAIDSRNNFVIAIAGNMFFVWDLWCNLRLESWHEEYSKSVRQWIKVVAKFEALNSFASFNFNFTDNGCLPTFAANGEVRIDSLKHPLLSSDQCIANDFDLSNRRFALITGANMAGKSTFLRT
ncbi:MAG: hypothetical protein HKN32_06485, partial [Flavobacteriales bacterium]|nr:hypothetical protein [Flavobacteriales bacterium]